ncbi:MAG: TetR/AcrR family transcriptional regulator C-terminal ligand-binding domain-containing protein [Chloroflexi bacterium]|nr:TetR/AcrR family transcriptional regulator C-terminal ligand-binding domain-containing protein [Chloroflexota bacterium]
MVGTFLAEKDRNPELIETFRRRLVEPRMRQMHTIFERAVARGELAAQGLIGMMLAQVSGAPIDRRVGGRSRGPSPGRPCSRGISGNRVWFT